MMNDIAIRAFFMLGWLFKCESFLKIENATVFRYPYKIQIKIREI